MIYSAVRVGQSGTGVLVVVDWLVLISVGSISYYSTCSTYLLSLTVDDANDIRSCDKY